MANIKILDAGGIQREVKGEGSGTPGDPFVLLRRNFNQKSSATLSGSITVGITSVVAKIANTDRRYLAISVTGNDVFVKLQAASVDDDSKGEMLANGDTWRMPVSAIYTGEVSCIKDGVGPNATIFVTEY
ncbi:MAG: hypothetical protein ACUZ8H_05525 [Candidatus Anammoxibacter sp.]